MNLRHIVVIGIYVCLCLKSTDGRHIRETGLKSTDGRHKRETGPCNPNPCQNGGTCTVDGTDYTCNCTRHFVGRDCEIYQIFCLNGGSCTVDGKDYTWNCTSQFGGINCETEGLKSTDGRHKRETGPCDPNPCQNGGTCTVDGTDYTCNCTSQFRGRDCESTGQCSTGWHIYGDKCFIFSSSTKTWEAANTSCVNDYSGYLAEIYRANENNFLEYTGKKRNSFNINDRCLVWTEVAQWRGHILLGNIRHFIYRVPDFQMLTATSLTKVTGYGVNLTALRVLTTFVKKKRQTTHVSPILAKMKVHALLMELIIHVIANLVSKGKVVRLACVADESAYVAEIINAEENSLLQTTGSAIITLTTGVWFGLKWHNGEDTFYWVTSGTLYNYRNWLGGWATGFSNVYC
ncbi:uncharacterized protein LOC132729785 [Ruditapes philippinarum]|uniref:uncharacterized protein LOC132729785 n=1 Tax=Ruditapes philippinarum TaxID=129788 RepID=UPI00295ADE39|nr:uncharacterized protein LOC132729785 [Ruditapes philippinarum]